MSPTCRVFLSKGFLALALSVLWTATLSAADAPRLRELRTQQVGETTYFHARFEKPVGLHVPDIKQWRASEVQRRLLARQPELVSPDGQALAVYPRLVIPEFRPKVGFSPDPPRQPVPVEGLEFVGKVRGKGKLKFLLLYPKDPAPPEAPRVAEAPPRPVDWGRVPVELDFAAAVDVPRPQSEGKRRPHQAPLRDDLEGLWAAAQADRLAVLEALTPEFSFYGFACEATGRKYGVHAPMLERGALANREHVHRQLYETTTGSAAITESLQLHRMLNPTFRDKDQRTIPIHRVPGIDIAEHPWRKMMGDRKPSPEPLAALVPHDNFYVHFKSIRKFIEFGELLDQWGTNLVRVYEVNSRDYFLKESYEKQLCLKSTGLAKTFGPAVVRSLALTGSDGYLREGTDLTVLFQVNNRQAFLGAVEPFLQEARKEFGDRLKETKADYHGYTVESFVSPLREVSLHRAAFGDFVIYSNSPVGLRRVLDTRLGRRQSLADSLDFQYMRTVFRLEDDLEDGFGFLSDAFIRQLVGPASKIKEKRRLEALTSLGMVTNAALFSAWETGKLPADHAALLAASALKPAEIYTPEGNGVTWDAGQRVAVSDVYNTLHFPTPLIELPLDKITPAEQREYQQFRTDYLNLWRRYFDPVGMRFSLNDRRVRVETYILPLIRNSEYDSLRQFAGDGTATLDPTRFAPATLIQGTVHLAPWVRNMADNALSQRKGGLGQWALIRVDDSPAFTKLAEWWVQQEFTGEMDRNPEREVLNYLEHFPVTFGVQVQDPKAFDKALDEIHQNFFRSATKDQMPPYHGVRIVRFQQQGVPTLYSARVDDGWYVSLSEAAVKDLIDRSVARREGKQPPAGDHEKPVEINGSLYLAPSAANKARDALRYYLEWQSHRLALGNGPIWYTLYRAGLLAEDAPEAVKRATAMRYLGFLPVSPDGAAYAYDAAADVVVNRRHGSYRQPLWHRGIDDGSPLGQLLGQFRTLRADLRFQEDGIDTTVTISRKR